MYFFLLYVVVSRVVLGFVLGTLEVTVVLEGTVVGISVLVAVLEGSSLVEWSSGVVGEGVVLFIGHSRKHTSPKQLVQPGVPTWHGRRHI